MGSRIASTLTAGITRLYPEAKARLKGAQPTEISGAAEEGVTGVIGGDDNALDVEEDVN